MSWEIVTCRQRQLKITDLERKEGLISSIKVWFYHLIQETRSLIVILKPVYARIG